MVYDHEHKSISLWELIKKNEGQKAREHEQTRIHVSAWFEAIAHLTIEIKIEERMDPNSNSPNSSQSNTFYQNCLSVWTFLVRNWIPHFTFQTKYPHMTNATFRNISIWLSWHKPFTVKNSMTKFKPQQTNYSYWTLYNWSQVTEWKKHKITGP